MCRSAQEVELYRQASRDPALATEMLDVFSRIRRATRFVSPSPGAALTVRALARPASDPRAILTAARAELRTAAADLRERRAVRRRG